jgi:hypothetical protein
MNNMSGISDGDRARAVTVARAAQAGTAVLAMLDRVIPVLRQVVRGVRFLAWAGIVSALAIVASILVMTWVPSGGALVFLVVLGLFLALPGYLLLLFHGAMVELLALPDWLRSSPDLARTHATELARLAGASTGRAPGGRQGGFVGNFFKAGKLLLEAHGDFPEYGRTLRLINVPFLFAVGVSLIAVLVEWLIAATMVIAAIFVTLL